MIRDTPFGSGIQVDYGRDNDVQDNDMVGKLTLGKHAFGKKTWKSENQTHKSLDIVILRMCVIRKCKCATLFNELNK